MSPQIENAPDPNDIKKSTRDLETLRGALEAWLAERLPTDAKPVISDVSNPSENGMSSETLLFDARWLDNGERVEGSFVARVEPDPDDCPIFPFYDLEGQYKLLAYVREHSAVAVPVVRWLELDASHLGAPFFVMERAEGRVPPDVLPYTFGSWLTEATPEQRRRLQDTSVGILADLHAIDASDPELDFLDFDLPGNTPL